MEARGAGPASSSHHIVESHLMVDQPQVTPIDQGLERRILVGFPTGSIAAIGHLKTASAMAQRTSSLPSTTSA